VASNGKNGRHRRLRNSNTVPRLPSRSWALGRLSGRKAELARIARCQWAHHLAVLAAGRTARSTIPDPSHPGRRRFLINDYPRPGYYHAPEYVTAAARDKASRAVRDMVLHPSGNADTPVSLPPPAQHSADLAETQPLASLEAAAELERAAHVLVGEHIRLARQADRTWLQIADALHLCAIACVNGESAADEAYDYTLRYNPAPGSHGFTWTCPACQQSITDHGPLARHTPTRRRPHGLLPAPHSGAGSLASPHPSPIGPASGSSPGLAGDLHAG
jgi:hypothetical protein